MEPPLIPNATARALFLARHGLARPPAREGRGRALADLIGRLGFVQVDSVQTLARAHDMILFSRTTDYRPQALRWLNDRARATFEGWTHDASVIPVEVLPHWRVKFARDARRLAERWPAWQGEGFRHEIEGVLDHLARHGASAAADIDGPEAERSTGWWDWRPSKTALEYLWRAGRIAVARREGFAKRYDLIERVYPEACAADAPPEAEVVDWACAAALDRLGFATSGELAAFFALATPAEAKDWVARGLAEGSLAPARLETAAGGSRAVVVRPETLEALGGVAPPTGRLRLLSPFDPLIRDRARAEHLFGFRFRIEIFVPEARRRYGYYVFPILEGARLVGRAEVVAARERSRVVLRALWPEPGVAFGRARMGRLEAELARAARFAGCDAVEVAPGALHAA